MQFLASTWWMFLIGGFFFAGMAMLVHMGNMKRVANAWTKPSDETKPPNEDVELHCAGGGSLFGAFFAQFRTVIILGLMGGVCEVLFAIGAVVRLMEYWKGQ